MNNYDWNLVLKDGGNGHSLWFDKNQNRYAIHTDNNRVLWIEPERTSKVWITHTGVLTLNIPVSKDGSDSSFVMCDFEFGIKIAKMFGIQIAIEDDLMRKIKEIIFLNIRLNHVPFFQQTENTNYWKDC